MSVKKNHPLLYKGWLKSFRRIGNGTKFKGIEVPRILVLSTDLRDGEREPEVTNPPEARPVAARAEPATNAVTARAQQDRNAVGVVDGFVHGNDVPQPHCFDLLIRELLTNEAGQFGFRLAELALVGLGANLLRDPVVVLEEHALENGDFGHHTARRLEVRRTEYLLGVVSDAETVARETLDPVLASRAVAGDREVDNAVFFAPRTWPRFGNSDLALKKQLGSINPCLLYKQFDNCIQLTDGITGGCKFCAHDLSPALTWAFCFPLIRGGAMA